MNRNKKKKKYEEEQMTNGLGDVPRIPNTVTAYVHGTLHVLHCEYIQMRNDTSL